MTIITIQQPFQTAFTIKTNDRELADLLRLRYGRFVTDDISRSIIAVTRKGLSCTVEFGGEACETVCPLQEIDRLLFTHTRYDERVFALHGAAVEWEGKAVLFLASTNSGKTTLASYLAGRGFGYITDDCSLLDRASNLVHPFPSPIHLREGGLEVLRRVGAEPEGLTLLDDPVLRRYIYTPANCVTEPLPLGDIFFIRRTDDENRVESMETTERVIALMKAPITPYPVTGAYLQFLSRLADTADCRRLFYGDMDYVVEVIRRG